MKRQFIYSFCFLFFFSSCYVGRFFVWNFANLDDNKKFDSVEIKNGPTVFQFQNGKSEDLVLPKSVAFKGKEISFDELLEKSKTVGFLVIKKDSILYEKYLSSYTEETDIPSFSMSKSFVSALVGIAIDDGFIKNVHEPITNYLPELDSAKFSSITIEDLLNMRSGIRFNEGYINPFGDVGKYYYGTNLKKYIKNLKIDEAPDKSFNYISVNTLLLGFIVENASGKKLWQYLEEKLWVPMGMEYPASWSVDHEKNQNIKSFCCLNAKMRDFAKFGRLYLNNGNWNGVQLISDSWVKQSLKPVAKNNYWYSYQWWHNVKNIETDLNYNYLEPINDFYAQGILGQYIYVYPEKKIIIVRMGKKVGYSNWPKLFLEIAKAN